MMAANELLTQDQAARLTALDISKSFIVQAPAGSGKTELLIQRYLKLLAAVQKPEEILAITFTKKAANEMRARVVKALQAALNNPEPESDHAKLTWHLAKNVLVNDKKYDWQLINNPNQVRIQTIDSLCTYLTKQLPILSHFGAQPDIAEKPSDLYRTAAREVLSHLEESYEWSQAIATLLLHLDNDMEKLYKLLVNLLAKRDQWLPYIHFDQGENDIRVILEATLQRIIQTELNTLTLEFPPQVSLELLELLRFSADNLSREKSNSGLLEFLGAAELPDCNPHNLSAWQGVSDFFLTASKGKYTWRKKPMPAIGFPTYKSLENKEDEKLHRSYQARYKALISQLEGNDSLKQQLINVRELPSPTYTDRQWQVLQSLLMALKISAAQLRVSFQQSKQIDFIENSQGALTALGTQQSPTDLALILDYQLKHILIDEFQDTSTNQYHLLQQLTAGWENDDGRTLFVVGDPMQSIYRFREADVGLFIRMWEHGLGHIKLDTINLSVNFRSLAPIVEWNNAHFSQIFPEKNDISLGAVTYSNSVAFNQDAIQENQIKVSGLLNADNETHATHIVEDILALRKQHPTDKIAILVRSRSHLNFILPELKAANLPYKAVDINPLSGRQVVIDLLTLTRAMLHLGDRIAWLAILRAPWCGLALKDLHELFNKHPKALVWEIITKDEHLLELSAIAKRRLKRFVHIMKNQLANRDRLNIRSWIETTWQQLGGPATLASLVDLDDAEEYFNILESLETVDIDLIREKVAGHYASTNHDSDLLQIMTIHSAKGLEFDTVILPQLHKKSSRDGKQLLLWMDQQLADDAALVLAPISKTGEDTDPIYQYIAKQQQAKFALEIDRLFYVATTRAKKRLYMYFNTTQKVDGTYSTPPGSLLQKLLPLLEKDFGSIITDCTQEDVDDTPEESTLTCKRLPLDWVNPLKLAPEPAILHQKIAGIMQRDDSLKQIGIVTHRILQQLATVGMQWWQHAARETKTSYIQRMLKQAGYANNKIDSATCTIHTMVENTLSDETGRWILSRHEQAASEQQIISSHTGTTEQLIVDRTFIANNVRWIVDYKTAINSDEAVIQFLDEEEKKYRQKMQRYKDAYQHIDQRPIKLGLYFPALPAWRVLE